MITPTPPPPRQTAQELALAALRDLLTSGALEPGERIRQEQLAARLGTSVVPVREALSKLQAEGLVRHVPHRGFRVATLTLAELSETYEIRRLLEDEVVRLATPRLTADHLDVLRATAAEMEENSATADIAAMVAANRRFHFTVFEAAGRPRMVEFIRLLWQTTDAYRSLYYGDGGARHRVNDEHRSIVEALASRDAERAVRELQAHRQHAVDDLALRLRSAPAEGGVDLT
ncbi:GntR family transcriptional regulator [Nocardioides zeae]|uniref:GntR family transcriptional regulator n=1 Tax=Nocardioides zeae TaxID=1457234 RepID=UPI00286BBB8B|nr:GntR family transcriptional regulator [Nocardioides zeae]